MKFHRLREGPITAIDTKSQLTTEGSNTAPGSELVPGAAKFLHSVRVSFANDMATAADGAYLGRLEGPGLARGPVVVAIGAAGASVATGGKGCSYPIEIPLGVEVVPNQEILFFAENVGEDLGSSEVAIEVTFSDELGGIVATKGVITVEGDCNSVDTLVRLTAQGSVTAPSRITPPDATKIHMLAVAFAADGLAAGAVTGIVRLSGNAIKGGEQKFTVGGLSGQTVQAGSDAAPFIMEVRLLEDLDVDINPSETLDISVEMAGVDIGDTTFIVSAFCS